ncbi:MAG: lysophospholipid acyltransferase family protein [Pseudomonadota bacterium]
MIFLRATMFNIFFYGFTVLACLILLPLVFFPRPVILATTKFYVNVVDWIEKYILGLNYEIRGLEHLPKEGTYIVAAKHQSAYETMKLHHLFGDPTIVLKRELLDIPIFGTFLKKLDVIPINRSNKEEAIAAIVSGAQRMAKKNRPIVIFPQGTRVNPDATTEERPYKGGIVKMYKNTDLKVIPLALNSGLFWGRKSYIKRPGTVTFEFLPPIEPGLPDKKVMKALEDRVEEASISLMNEAKENYSHLKSIPTLSASQSNG